MIRPGEGQNFAGKMAIKKAYRSINDHTISLSNLLTVVMTLVFTIGVMTICSAQTKKAAAVQTQNNVVKDDHNTPMPDNTAMVIPVDNAASIANDTETGSAMDRAISNYVYQQKAKKAETTVSAAKKNNTAVATKELSVADKKNVEATPVQ